MSRVAAPVAARDNAFYGAAIMPNLLIELFSEEIPARLQARAADDLARLMTAKLKGEGLEAVSTESFYGPRRLTFTMTGLPMRSPNVREEKKGPRVGAPEKAVEGFLRSAGLSSLKDAEIREDKKGQTYFAVIEKPGRAARDAITEALQATIMDFPWPKSQRWGDGNLKWVRPLRRVLISFDGQGIPFALDNGSQPIEGALMTETHRVLGQGIIEIADIDAYEKALADGRVILRAEDRKARIRDGARTLCAEAGLELFEDEGLLSEVAGLAEWPTPHLGRFDEKFLALPDEVITAAMRGHQKYFSVRAPKTGRLAPHFIAVADIEAGEGMLAGYERVLTARLSDALFLYNNDRQVSLEKHGEKLAGVTFFEGLGTLDDKVKRVAILARELAPLCGADPDDADRAARLAKADLSTEMVYEFPELQGLMGRYYALDQDVPVDIADAIRDHYKPQGQGDDLPTNALGVTVSLADKLDTLTAFWSIDQKPTGSRDPFALRRAALAVIRLILENTLRLELMATLAKAFAAQSQTSDVSQDLLAFFHDRLTVYFRDQGFRHDQVAAALTKGADDFVLVAQRLKALSEFLGTDEGTNLSAAYKRARNILKVEEKKGALPSFGVNPDHLQEAEEKDLHASLLQAEAGTRTRLGDEDFGGAMLELSKIRSGLDRFFNAVTVNADNAALRDNRLALLLRFVDVVQLVADFDRLEG